MRSYGIRVGPKPMTVPLEDEGSLDTEIYTHTGRTPCDNRGREWSDVPTNQETPRTVHNY